MSIVWKGDGHVIDRTVEVSLRSIRSIVDSYPAKKIDERASIVVKATLAPAKLNKDVYFKLTSKSPLSYCIRLQPAGSKPPPDKWWVNEE